MHSIDRGYSPLIVQIDCRRINNYRMKCLTPSLRIHRIVPLSGSIWISLNKRFVRKYLWNPTVLPSTCKLMNDNVYILRKTVSLARATCWFQCDMGVRKRWNLSHLKTFPWANKITLQTTTTMGATSYAAFFCFCFSLTYQPNSQKVFISMTKITENCTADTRIALKII